MTSSYARLLTSSGSNFRVPQVNFYRAVQTKDASGVAQAVALTFMGTRADKWPKERLEGMAGFFTKSAIRERRVEGRDHLSSIPIRTRRRFPRRPFPDGTAAEFTPDAGPARGVCRLADQRPKTPGSRGRSSTACGTGCWAAGSSTSPTISARTTRRRIPNCWTTSTELLAADYDLKHVYPVDPQLEDVPAFVDSEDRPPEGRGPLCLVSGAPPGCRGADRRLVPDHRNDRELFEHHSRSRTRSFRRTAVDRPADGSITQPVPGAVRPAAARHAAWNRNATTAHGRPAPAPAQFLPHSAEDRAAVEAARLRTSKSDGGGSANVSDRPAHADPSPELKSSTTIRVLAWCRGGGVTDLIWTLDQHEEFLYRH